MKREAFDKLVQEISNIIGKDNLSRICIFNGYSNKTTDEIRNETVKIYNESTKTEKGTIKIMIDDLNKLEGYPELYTNLVCVINYATWYGITIKLLSC